MTIKRRRVEASVLSNDELLPVESLDFKDAAAAQFGHSDVFFV